MNPWESDAREAIKGVSDIDDDLIEQTIEIRDFLKADRYFFVTATKGLGKSLLLLTKRKHLKGIDYILPKDTLLDVPSFAPDALSKEAFSLLLDEKAMELVWSLSILLSIIKKVTPDEIPLADVSQSLKHLLHSPRNTPSDYFYAILTTMSIKQLYRDLESDYSTTVIPIARTINKSIAIFIDNVDECLEQKKDMAAWYAAQTGLVRAVYKLVRLNPGKFKLFVSIRKEAFLKLRTSSEMYTQYKGMSVDLSYYPDELKDIFIKNIDRVSYTELADKSKKKDDPILAFLGTNQIHNLYTGEKENIFEYIYRHTLERPRDLMQIGREISRCPLSERDQSEKGIDRLRTIINETASSIAETYIVEVSKHLAIDREDINRLFGLLYGNVLEKHKLKNICMLFNGNDAECLRKDCKSCNDQEHVHIFCELYKIGLLGYVAMGPTNGQYIQRFVAVGEKTFEEDRLLPHSTHYLMHPILEGIIRGGNSSYRINGTNTIGYDRPWKMTEQPSHIPDTPKIPLIENKIEPPFRLSKYSPGLMDKNDRFLPLSETQHRVLVALFLEKELPILPYETVAKILIKSRGGDETEIRSEDDDRKLAQQFARGLRRDLKKNGITHPESIINLTDAKEIHMINSLGGLLKGL